MAVTNFFIESHNVLVSAAKHPVKIYAVHDVSGCRKGLIKNYCKMVEWISHLLSEAWFLKY